MAKPAPTSIRVTDTQEIRLAAFMTQHKIQKRGTAILRLMDLGFQLNDDMPSFVVKPGPKTGNTPPPKAAEPMRFPKAAPGARFIERKGRSKWAT